MRAVQVTALTGPDDVGVADVEDPGAGAGRVVIDVHAAGVTFPDVLLTRGQYQIKPDLPFVPGSEIAGTVRSAPEGSGFSPGDRVAAFPAFGGFAERAAVDPAMVFPLPDGMSYAAGAGLPMNYLTVHFGLVRRGRLRAGETVLVQGAAGGVGTAAVQLARALGARVIAVVSSDAKAETSRRAGAHETVPAEGFRSAVAALTDGRGVDVVVDPVGGDRFTDSLRSLAPEGRMLVIGFTGGEIPTVKVNRLLLNNIEVVGVGWGAFWLPRPAYLREQWDDLMPHLEAGRLDPLLGATYPLDGAAEALRELDERRARGKVVLTVR
ncbi:NADPH:quinone oxidoreductase family protein [Streptomyces sp. DSM 42041]|uniref:NADPH:quinone oxidoreductase family protein n=1 Tax=Streptomyces hazeniae TaxID=3075538 RepID=A0ABU2NST8_9ACTN|nr:NADPH:quinone oxidoreductase family protein [Streptomyces sp. DSM 42041]MDT0380052.1 NADPH:quinone oxidoreductase family protein [Streptomyces sp. DSM 42041]